MVFFFFLLKHLNYTIINIIFIGYKEAVRWLMKGMYGILSGLIYISDVQGSPFFRLLFCCSSITPICSIGVMYILVAKVEVLCRCFNILQQHFPCQEIDYFWLTIYVHEINAKKSYVEFKLKYFGFGPIKKKYINFT